jgi:hypothetical protein
MTPPSESSPSHFSSHETGSSLPQSLRIILFVTIASGITSSQSFLVSKVAGIIIGIALTWPIAGLSPIVALGVPYLDYQLKPYEDQRKLTVQRQRILRPVTDSSLRVERSN